MYDCLYLLYDWNLGIYNCIAANGGSPYRKQVLHDPICINKNRLTMSSEAVRIKITIEEE